MKTLVGAILTVCVLTVMAAGVKTDFSTQQGGKNWILNSWSGFKPSPKVGYDAQNKCWHIGKAPAKYGCGLNNSTEKFKAKAGDTLIIKFEVKGTGKFFVGVQNFTDTGKFIGVPAVINRPLKATWAKETVEFKVSNCSKTLSTGIVMPYCGVSANSEVFIKNISYELKK